jgi:hypothetical protein
MIGFVDDSMGQANAFVLDNQPPAEHLVALMQSDAQLWNDLLWASGGALELPKCTYHVIDYAFTSDGAPILRGGKVGGDIILHTGDRTNQQQIPFKSAHCSHKTLGHYKEPSGNQTKQYQVLLEKSNNAGIFVQCSALNRRETWTYYFAIYLPSIGYPLPNCHFSRKQLHTIQSKGMSAIFAKCGFNRKTKGLYSMAHHNWEAPLSDTSTPNKALAKFNHFSDTGGVPPKPVNYCVLRLPGYSTQSAPESPSSLMYLPLSPTLNPSGSHLFAPFSIPSPAPSRLTMQSFIPYNASTIATLWIQC